MNENEKTPSATASLDEVAGIKYLDKNSAEFETRDELLYMKLKSADKSVGADADKTAAKADTTAAKADSSADKPADKFTRVFLHRSFPFDCPEEYISVQDGDKKEIGLIKKLSDFDADTEKLLMKELKIKYYAPKITEIYSVKERYGFSYWRVLCDCGETEFTLHDTYRSMSKVTPTKIVITDIDGNRYQIEDTEKLDRKSFRKIELYM